MLSFHSGRGQTRMFPPLPRITSYRCGYEFFSSNRFCFMVAPAMGPTRGEVRSAPLCFQYRQREVTDPDALPVRPDSSVSRHPIVGSGARLMPKEDFGSCSSLCAGIRSLQCVMSHIEKQPRQKARGAVTLTYAHGLLHQNDQGGV